MKDMFFGINLTDEQKNYRDSIMSKDYDIIFCNSKSGTGKTTIAVATARLLVASGKYDGLKYIFSAVQESTLGYTSGDLQEKEAKYLLPLTDALYTINEVPDKAMGRDMISQKKGTAWVEANSHTFMRGSNISRKVVIIDECQNYTTSELQKVLTRCHDTCKVICLGHVGQIDLKNKSMSGFENYITHFKHMPRCCVCELTQNFRGWIANHADTI